METIEKKVKFDPGFAPIVMDSLGQAGYLYYTFSAISNIKLKKLNFLPTYKKIEPHLKSHIAFYLGCLMWASYIKKFDNYELDGNKLLGEICKEEEYTSEIDFLIDLVSYQMPRDYKYFANKNIEVNQQYLTILKTYREFLVLNKGFCACSKTNEIKLPKNIKTLNDEEKENLNSIIQNAINEKNIDLLLDNFEILF